MDGVHLRKLANAGASSFAAIFTALGGGFCAWANHGAMLGLECNSHLRKRANTVVHITVWFINPENDQPEEVLFYPEEFSEIKDHEFFDEETTEIMKSSPKGITDLSVLGDLSMQIEAIGEAAVEAWIESHQGYNGENLEGLYLGTYDSVEEYARELVEQQGGYIPADLEAYIEWESYARDTVTFGDYDVMNDDDWGVYIFKS